MCTVGDDFDDIVEMSPTENLNIIDGLSCQKCNANDAKITLRGKDLYCESCFLIAATHKFRATLGKSKVVRPTDKILVGHSGEAPSSALLHLIKSGMSESVHKRLVFDTKVIYIDDGMLRQQSPSERQTTIGNIIQQTKSFCFQVYATSLSKCLSKDESISVEEIDNYMCTLDDNDQQLITIFNNLSNDTARRDLLEKLRNKVIVSAAKYLGCGKIFLADISTSLAISILSNVALGRGAQLSEDIGFIDKRHSDFVILRPMRDFNRHELNCYMNIHHLEVVDVGISIKSRNPHGSIQQLTEKFVVDLDSQCSGTVSTIFRTGEKLSTGRVTSRDNRDDDEICVLCNGIIDTSHSDDSTSAMAAITFSRFMSCEGAKTKLESVNSKNIQCTELTEKSKTNCSGECENNCIESNQTNIMSLNDIRKCMCYGCRLIFHDEFNPQLLPSYIADGAKQKLSLARMRDEINDFLL